MQIFSHAGRIEGDRLRVSLARMGVVFGDFRDGEVARRGLDEHLRGIGGVLLADFHSEARRESPTLSP